MKKILIYWFVFTLLCSSLFAAPDKFIGCLYTIPDNTVTLTWIPGQNVEYYEVQLILVDKNSSYPILTTTTPTIKIQRPRSGFFTVRVRSCNGQTKSSWIYSDVANSAKVDGNNMAWRIYWKLPSPGGVIID